MKRYLLAELQSTWTGTIIVTGIYVFFFVIAATVDSWDIHQFFTNTAITFWISTGVMGSAADKEKRDRHYALLPLPLREFARVRLYDLFLHKAYLLLFWIVFLFMRPDGFRTEDFWYMMSFSVLAVCVIMVFVVNHDLGFYHTRKYQLAIGILFLVSVATLIWAGIRGHLQILADYYDELTHNPVALSVYVVLLLVLSLLSIRVFMRRKSYVA